MGSHKIRNNYIDEIFVRSLIAQLCNGIWCVHLNSLILHNIKIENIFLDLNAPISHAYLADFIFACKFESPRTDYVFLGKGPYLAPEFLNKTQP